MSKALEQLAGWLIMGVLWVGAEIQAKVDKMLGQFGRGAQPLIYHLTKSGAERRRELDPRETSTRVYSRSGTCSIGIVGSQLS